MYICHVILLTFDYFMMENNLIYKNIAVKLNYVTEHIHTNQDMLLDNTQKDVTKGFYYCSSDKMQSLLFDDYDDDGEVCSVYP